MEGGAITAPDYIPIVDLDRELCWTSEEMHIVYDKLRGSAEQLLEKLKKKDSVVFERMMNFENLVYEMIRFINLHRQDLAEENGMDGLYHALDEMYKQLTDYANLEISIFSDNESEMESCLEVLASRVKKDGIQPHIVYVNILITRLLCRNLYSYSSVLNYMQYYVRSYLNKSDDFCLMPQLALLMDKLTLDEFRILEQDVIVCAEFSILMAEHLQKLGMKCKGIDYWMEVKKNRYFNWRMCEGV